MLKDKEMFGIPDEKIGQIASELTIWSLPPGLFATLFVGYLFELLGRKWTIFLSFIITAGFYICIPFTAPNYSLLVVVRCAIGVTMAAPISHPLIADYVHRKSQGKAVGFMGLGLVFGELISMGVLFNLTKKMDFREAFAVATVVIIVFSFYFLAVIKDPDMNKLRKGMVEKLNSQDEQDQE